MLEEVLIEKAFTVPILKYNWKNSDELNNKLRNIILIKEETSVTIKRSNRGGWHSRTDLLSWNDESIKEIEKRIYEILAIIASQILCPEYKKHRVTWSIVAWANVSRSGNYNAVHNHGSNTWSGVYYVCTGNSISKQPFEGIIELQNPNLPWSLPGFLTESFVNCSYNVTPKPGLMILFPGYINHSVKPFTGDSERISIAFNAQISQISE